MILLLVVKSTGEICGAKDTVARSCKGGVVSKSPWFSWLSILYKFEMWKLGFGDARLVNFYGE